MTINSEPAFDSKTGDFNSKYKEFILKNFNGAQDVGFINEYVKASVNRIVSEVTSTEMTDVQKAKALHDWLCDNTAFDDYALDTFGTNREDYYSDSSGKYDLYDTRVGVCTDVAEAFMIMCRYNGIPCVICENDGHRWNAVYINDFWYETDLTNDMYRRAVSEDMSEIILNGSRGYTPIDLSSNILAVNPACSGSEGGPLLENPVK